jgi:hypothetical protein
MGASITMRDRLNAEISHVEAEITRLNLINAHLNAGGVVVEPLSDVDEAELRRLAGDLDRAIVEDRIVSATFEFLIDLLDKAQDLGDLIQKHT